jgi:hypothetical protein
VQRLEGGVPLERRADLAAEVRERPAARRGRRAEVQVAEAGEGGLEQPPPAGGRGGMVDEVRVVASGLGSAARRSAWRAGSPSTSGRRSGATRSQFRKRRLEGA